MNKKLPRILLSFVSAVSLLVNSLYTPLFVWAQEETPNATPVAEMTSDPTAEPSSFSEETASPTPDNVTPAPTDTEVTTTETPASFLEPTSSPIETEVPKVEAEVLGTQEQGDNTNPDSQPSSSETATPSPEPREEIKGEIKAEIIKKTDALSLTEFDFSYREDKSATLVTDRGDYTPTDAVVITGTGFIPNTEYELVITSDTGNYRFSDRVKSDESGNLFYTHQLDGISRPLYKIEAKDLSGVVLTSTTFTDPVAPWQTIVQWQDYLDSGGHIVNDFEKTSTMGTDDPSHGPANVPPEETDIASGADKSGKNPGDFPSLQYYYSDGGTSGCTGTNGDDDYLFLRMRLMGDPTTSGGSDAYFKTYHWDFLIDADGNKTSDFVIDIFGGKTSGSTVSGGDKGTIGIYPNDPGNTSYTPSKFLWVQRADKSSNDYTRSELIDYGDAVASNNQYWIEAAIPVNSNNTFKAALCGQANLNNKLFASTSASNTDPLQKDWMGADAFFVSYVQHKIAENLTHPGFTTQQNPAQPGDIIRYTLTVLNNGNLIIPGFVITENISDILEYANLTGLDPDGNGKSALLSSNNLSWPAQDIVKDQTISEQFEVTVKPSSQWPSSGDFIMTNVYGDTINIYLPPNGTLTVIKHVVGGTAVASDWTMHIQNTVPSDVVTPFAGAESPGTGHSLIQGNYHVYETGGPVGGGYSLSYGTDCPNGNVTVTAGQVSTCTLINTRDTGKIIINKVIDPTNDSGKFDLYVDGVIKADDVGNGGTSGEVVVNTGAHSISELAGTTANLSDYNSTVFCGTNTPSAGTSLSDIQVNKNQTVICTFTNILKRGSISGYKYEDADGNPATAGDRSPLANWEIKLFSCVTSENCGLSSIATTQTNSSGFYSFENLIPGYYKVLEVLQGGWTSLFSPLGITLDPGENDENNNFVNFHNATATVCKEDTEDNPIPGWNVTVGSQTKQTGSNGCISFEITQPGHYDVTEESRTGWTPIGTTSYGFDAESNGSYGPYHFTNFQHLMISGYKWNDINYDGVNEAEPRLNDWVMFIDGNANGLYDFGEEFTQTAGNGEYQFTITNPGTYSICETLQNGWLQTSPGNFSQAQCHTVPVASGVNVGNKNFGNFEPEPGLSTVKSNYSDTIAYVGEDVVFDITVTNTGNMVLYGMGASDIFDTAYLDYQKATLTYNSITTDITPFSISAPFVDTADYDKDLDTTELVQEIVWKGLATLDLNESMVIRVYFIATGFTPLSQLAGNGALAGGCTLDEGTCDSQNPSYIESQRSFASVDIDKPADIQGKKFFDENGNSAWDGGENPLSGVNIFLYSWNSIASNYELADTDTTIGDGSYEFSTLYGDKVSGNKYLVCEEVPAGYYQTYPLITTVGKPVFDYQGKVCYQVEVFNNGEIFNDFNFGNSLIVPKINISKSNDKPSASAGDIVTYTLKISNTGNIDVSNIEVTDILPAGFSYQTGTADVDKIGETDEPSVNGQILNWTLSSLAKGETATITYKVKIADDQKPAKYPNLATCKAGGREQFAAALLLRGVLECNNGIPVVSTVTLGQGYTYGGSLTPQVLGAATELPATGNPSWVLILALIFGLGGLGLKLAARKEKYEKIKIAAGVFGFLMGLILLVKPALAVTTTVNILDLPEYTRDDNFYVSYTAISDDPASISAQFYYMKDGGSYQALGGAFTGPSNKIQVTGSQVNESNKKYYFKVVLGSGEYDETSITYDNSGPDPVGGYSKERLGLMTYRIKWHTPNNDDFAQVVIYRGESTGFEADSGHEVFRQGGDKDKDYEWIDNGVSPDKDYFYLIRALDKAGNSSGLVGDAGTTTVQASPSVKGTSEGKVRVLPKEEGEVLSEESNNELEATSTSTTAPTEAPQGVAEKTVAFAKNRTKLFIGILALAAIVGFAGYRFLAKRQKE